jgi:hypothetical protein
MKRNIILTLIVLVSACVFSSFTGSDAVLKKKPTTGVYVFGFSASFTDSTVYFTPIQYLDGVVLEKKTKFLPGAPEYSYQLKDYLEQQRGEKNRVCAIFADETKAKAEKHFINVRKRYLNQKMNVVFLTEQEFQYQKIQPEAPAAEETTETTNP